MTATDQPEQDLITDDLVSDFIDESHQILEKLNVSLMNLEELVKLSDDGILHSVDTELMNELFRGIHSLKGLSGMLGFQDVNSLTHNFENILDKARHEELSINHGTIDLIYRSADVLAEMIDEVKEGSGNAVEYDHLIEEMKSVLASQEEGTPSVDSSLSEIHAPDEDPLEKEETSLVDIDQKDEQEITDQHLEIHIQVRKEFSSISNNSDITKKYLGIYIDETETILDELTDGLIISDENREDSTNKDLLCGVHRIKGSAAAVGLDRPAKLAHYMEDILQEFNNSQTELPIQLTDALLKCLDGLRNDLKYLKLGETVVDEFPTLVAELLVINSCKTTPKANQTTDESGVTKVNANESIKNSASASPESEQTQQETVQETDRRKVKRTDKTSNSTTSKPNETLRVDIERLDQLMNLAGQLVINKARFFQLGEGLRSALPHKQCAQLINNSMNLSSKITNQICDQDTAFNSDQGNLDLLRQQMRRLNTNMESIQREFSQVTNMRNGVANLFEAVHQLERVSDGIQKSVMDTRMVSIGPLFGRFRRVVRDIARSREKNMRLDIHGDKTELDKRMVDELGDPLIHMIRNSADHGIETPEERIKVGKPAEGVVKLDAFHQGNSIIIQVIDDGKGINTNRILEKAIIKGLISQSDAERMTQKQIQQLIWEPGFSTAEKVTEISGRGMGMDIVRSKIEEINGTVEVDSTEGVGTTFTIKLPLTMAILPSLLARINEQVYSFSIESVIEIVSIRPEDFSTVYGKRTATVRKRVVSIVTLSELFNDPGASDKKSSTPTETIVVIIGQEGKEIGVVVDGLLGEEDIVVKSLAENFENVSGFSGASILGDGSVSLILDSAMLMQLAASDGNS
ncbi:MAG: hypothetical protein COA78_30325 [Blastopirellula sp.]|nr:MAG: hypothetical protein COA78_30325 [Blastopirellula sp.]